MEHDTIPDHALIQQMTARTFFEACACGYLDCGRFLWMIPKLSPYGNGGKNRIISSPAHIHTKSVRLSPLRTAFICTHGKRISGTQTPAGISVFRVKSLEIQRKWSDGYFPYREQASLFVCWRHPQSQQGSRKQTRSEWNLQLLLQSMKQIAGLILAKKFMT